MCRIQSLIKQGTFMGITGLILLCLIFSCASWLLPQMEILSVSTEGDIRISFSAPPTEASIRKAFSMTEDGTSLQGEFFFNDSDVIFKPLNGLRENREYSILISTVAEDIKGNSLTKDFRYRFHTKENLKGPRIIRVEPQNETSLTLPPAAITVFFSGPVDTNSFTEALRLSPSVTHVLEWNEACSTVRIIPVKPLTPGTRYTITVSTALMDLSRNKLLLPFNSTFLYGTDRSPPRCYLSRESSSNTTGNLIPGTLNEHIPSDSKLKISFDKEVSIESLAGFIGISPALGMTVTPNLERRDRGIISFPQKPEWGKPYTLTIRKGITDTFGNKTEEDIEFPLVFNHSNFKPPVFAWGGLKNQNTMERISRDTDFSTISFDPNYFQERVDRAMDLYLVFSITEDADSLSFVSATRAISISATNGCAEISIRTMKVLTEAEYTASDIYDPAMLAGNGEKFCALKMGIEFENAKQLGLIIFSINKELSDSLGNTMTGNITLTYNKQ
ncbi:hypothetical protein AGMMS49579_19560 [Spirochaetia bacterium]|nr:hypothetical protein AGMMS49579_19560 [Spirochaetia bacterium]